ncbi:glyoxalase/bleomycin resistance protein/dioxygenase [Gracilibacillus halophilus YIM-C55.5]|uniref:Glyoxalase/bleomycin resistance protein/dioxygenase n=1 Tax=Gracilibacillus halophilus YIM-C55.5 TaxID=1308866 RepID=N4WEB8_9BACI|nr:VOC family protein [Gracilibacillus halophilus]ENH97564.1 glyoxalase/bleomycin resistance protein/dioxygenase [Gracilibacillus halophilus YIM-C55.5]
MEIIVNSIFVEDQNRALAFYTEKLGFLKKQDIPVGEFKWLTLVSSNEQNGTELLLEPNQHPAAKEYQQRIFEDGIPATMFGVEDIQAEYERLTDNGVVFTMKPTDMDGVTIAVFDDTCGNLIQIVEQTS